MNERIFKISCVSLFLFLSAVLGFAQENSVWKIQGTPVYVEGTDFSQFPSNWTMSAAQGSSAAYGTRDSVLGITGRGEPDKAWYVRQKKEETFFAVPDGSVVRLTVCARKVSGDGRMFLALSGMLAGQKAGDRFVVTKNIEAEDFTTYRSWFLKTSACDRLYFRFTGYGEGSWQIKSVSVDYADASFLKQDAVTRNDEVFVNGHFEGPLKSRPVERLGRGVSVIKLKTGGQFITWRYLKRDDLRTCFTVSRKRNGKEKLLTSKPLTGCTNYTDISGRPEDSYVVRTYSDKSMANLLETSEADGSETEYFAIPLDEGEQVARGGFAIGDIDGDGENDYIIKTSVEGNIDPSESSGWRPSKRPFILKAFDHYGEALWEKNLGWNIEAGIWYSPYVVCDLDGDGECEVILKTGEDTENGGQDYRGKDGRVYSGPQYLSVLKGSTGQEICRTDWVGWDAYENEDYSHAVRNQLAIAYLDGKTPCVVMLSGTYGHQQVKTFFFKDGQLVPVWSYNNLCLGKEYQGQGAHWTVCADLDEDGRDEVLIGSVCLDDNGQIMWTTGRGHPDAVYYGEINPDHPGKELLFIYETRQKEGGFLMTDLEGNTIWKLEESTDHLHSQAMCADIDPKLAGREFYAMNSAPGHKKTERKWYFSGNGTLLKKNEKIDDQWGWSPSLGYVTDKPYESIFRTREFRQNSDFNPKGYILMIADIEGDWREEVITSQSNELRIYSTVDSVKNRHTYLMQDDFYHGVVTNNSSGYAQKPELPDGLFF